MTLITCAADCVHQQRDIASYAAAHRFPALPHTNAVIIKKSSRVHQNSPDK